MEEVAATSTLAIDNDTFLETVIAIFVIDSAQLDCRKLVTVDNTYLRRAHQTPHKFL